MNKRKGFTLVELAIVIAILGILAVVAIPKYQDMVSEARSAEAKAQLGTVRSALAISYAKNKGFYPGTLDGTIFATGAIPGVDIGSGASAAVATSVANPIVVVGTTGGWIYNSTTGEVRINSTDTDGPSGPAWSTY